MILLDIFFSFLQIGLFSIGGGYAALPLIETQVVDVHGWLSFSEFTDLITISQMTPGPIAINSATFVGIRVAGIPGAIVATIGCILPSIIIVAILAYFYFKYKTLDVMQGIIDALRPAVIALIAIAGLGIAKSSFLTADSSFDFIALGLFALGFIALRFFKMKSTSVILLIGAVGGGVYLLF